MQTSIFELPYYELAVHGEDITQGLSRERHSAQMGFKAFKAIQSCHV